MTTWQTKSSKVVYENPWMVVHEDTIVTPDGKDGVYGYVDSTSGSTNVVPIDDEGNTYLVEQWRYPTKGLSLEVIGGRTDDEDIEKEARRELLEESGLEADELIRLGETEIANGITTFKSIIFIAKGIRQVSDEIDAEEGITRIVKLPFAEARQKVMSGEIKCAQSIVALYMAEDYLEKQK